MPQEIYKSFRGKGTEAWYQLSKDEQDALLKRVNDGLAEVGARTLFICDSYWASEQNVFFGVEVFPSVDALQQYHKMLHDLNWSRYVSSESLLGTLSSSGSSEL